MILSAIRPPWPNEADAKHVSCGIALVLAVFVAALTIIATATSGYFDTLHHDMTEAWSWGREFQLSYDKHPPLFAWIAGAWFKIFPRNSFFFFLLASLVAATGLLGVAVAARKIVPRVNPAVPVLLLMLTPGFTLFALRYNANSVLLLTWPWALAVVASALDRPTALKGIALGAILALAMLTKYFSVVLVIVCIVAAILHPNRATVWRSPAPYLAALTGMVVLTPHILWLLSAEKTPIAYALSIQKDYSTLLPGLRNGVLGLASQVVLIVGAVALANIRTATDWRGVVAAALSPRNAWVTWLALGPSVVAMVLAIANHVPHSTLYLIPAFSFLPLALFLASGATISATVAARTAKAVAAIWLSAAVVQGAMLVHRLGTGLPEADPGYDLAALANETWSSKIKLPLKVVCGDGPISNAVAFYSPSAPSTWRCYNPVETPWITARMLHDDGFLIVCEKGHPACMRALDKHRPQAIYVGEHQSRRSGRMLPARNLDLMVLVAPPAGLLD